jgi:hypothetical protein
MAKNTPTPYDTQGRNYDQAVTWLRDNGFDLLEAPGAANRIFLKKYNCSAAIEKADDGAVRVFAWPGCLIGGEIAKLINRGYQQFFKTTKTEFAATAEKLRALHDFTEEFKQALDIPSLYNESLGTVSEGYHYDRVNGRETPSGVRPVRPWEAKKKARKKA